jgi:tetratricopeptide (TPR) repeat protein
MPIFLLFVSAVLPADPVDDLLEEVDRAVAEESYTRAIALLEEGKRMHPGDVRLSIRAGRLYRDRELYHLALAEFRSAESINPSMPDLLHDISGVLGYLGENESAVEVLERLVRLDDDTIRNSAIDDLSWMYFKTYRMYDGISLLEDAMETGFDRNWAHTLGTLYAGLYDPEKSRYWYNRSIEDALNSGDEFFASIAYYNLSLLEFTFYRYDEARKQAERSLELRSRAGGHMVLGELDFLAWRLVDALEAYRTAESLDQTPLALMDMASFYQRIGYLEESLRFIDEIKEDPDDSWMFHYGVDRTRFGIDLNRILADSWLGKVRVEAMTPRAGPGQRLSSLLNRIAWRVRALYHERLYRSLTSSYSRRLQREGNELDARWNAAAAAEGYRKIALLHFEQARQIETALTPLSIPWYALEIGRESRDTGLLIEALNGFSPDEGTPYERTLRALADREKSTRRNRLELPVLSELYKMNPGGLRQYGLSLPVVLNVTGEGSRIISRKLKALLRHSGYRVVRHETDAVSTALLTVNSSESGTINWYMSDMEGLTRSQSVSDYSKRKKDLTPVLISILNGFYTTRLTGTDI